MKRIYKSNRVQRIKFTMRASIRFRGGVNRVHHRCKHLPLLNVCKSVQVNDSDTNDLPRSRQEFLSFLSCLTWLSVAERWRRTARERKKRGKEREREVEKLVLVVSKVCARFWSLHTLVLQWLIRFFVSTFIARLLRAYRPVSLNLIKHFRDLSHFLFTTRFYYSINYIFHF